ncbi:Flp pilus assembly protein TadG [Paenibacillus sp. SORGH_AS306]|uniref:Flp1 family type IVb pilin n=1 Tax=unclassified Paenibacillus TaxID=185978 RepID=UPI00278A16FA|nr:MULTISPECIES: Flp1 family type IVb pilin [unclassified Paenibacillus]MDQ1233049.1 Flp pilus assembly protein TadG [Paenibacillus sp. SORGH_AS_0306]MDR6110094.1 Flp pilus assembly protein TadG [Paenibacillus sp. SORGH_AS_0338]
MTNLIKGSWSAVQNFWSNEEGIGTLEMVLIVAVILIIALAFKEKITGIVNSLLAHLQTKSETFKQP